MNISPQTESKKAQAMKRFFHLLLVLALCLPVVQAQSLTLDVPNAEWQHNVKAEKAKYKGKVALRVTDGDKRKQGFGEFDDRLLILPETNFQDGEITLELAGEVAPNAPEGARGFVGIAFRVQGKAEKFEAFYLRPTNGRADDQVRRNHSAQYISHPDFPWQKLRKESPEKYESYVDLVPGDWTKVRIVVKGTQARLYVHGASQPTLLVNDLKSGSTSGAIGLWIGPGTIGHFTNVKVSK
jgi:hypothetical protein